MATVDDVARLLEAFAPVALAEEWDNVGLLVGDRGRAVNRVMTCLTVTPASAAEAIRGRVDLIVSHHPLPFRPLKQLTTDRPEGKLLWELIGAGVSIYSPHTAFDSAIDGINAQLAAALTDAERAPLVARVDGPGVGRAGTLAQPTTLADFAGRVKQFLRIEQAQCVGALGRPVQRVGFASGSGGELIAAAVDAGCDCLVTGEARFHAALEAEAAGLGLILAGHYATERFGVETLAEHLAHAFPSVACWASRDERDPLFYL